MQIRMQANKLSYILICRLAKLHDSQSFHGFDAVSHH